MTGDSASARHRRSAGVEALRCAGGFPLPKLLPVLLAAVLVVAGCGGSPPTEPANPGPTSLSTATPGPTTGSARADIPVTLNLRRRDAPPAGVATQVGLFAGGGLDCEPDDPLTNQPATRPTVYLAQRSPLVIPVNAWFCFPGFSPDVPLDVEVAYPDGRTERHQVGHPGDLDVFFFHFSRLPGDAVGRHRIVGRQGRASATLEFEVVRPERPRLLRVSAARGRDGEVFRLALDGFASGQLARLHIYRKLEPEVVKDFHYLFGYHTSLEVPTDATGAADLLVAAATTNQPGCYLIHLGQPDAAFDSPPGDEFCISRKQPPVEPGTVLVILASKRTEQEAWAEVGRLGSRLLLRRVGMVVESSSNYPLLRPGYWIVHTGLGFNPADLAHLSQFGISPIGYAQDQVRELRAEVSGVYAKQASP